MQNFTPQQLTDVIIGIFRQEKPEVSRAILHGPVGTGKTSLAFEIARARGTALGALTIEQTISRDMGSANLLGFWQLREKEFFFSDGPIAKVAGANRPATLILNEISDAPPEIETVLMNVLDDAKVRQIYLPDGRVLRNDNLVVIATSNESPVNLRPAIADRFDVTIKVDKPQEGILESLSSDLSRFAINYYDKIEYEPYLALPTVRRLLAYDALRRRLHDKELAAALVFAEASGNFLSALDTLTAEAS